MPFGGGRKRVASSRAWARAADHEPHSVRVRVDHGLMQVDAALLDPILEVVHRLSGVEGKGSPAAGGGGAGRPMLREILTFFVVTRVAGCSYWHQYKCITLSMVRMVVSMVAQGRDTSQSKVIYVNRF